MFGIIIENPTHHLLMVYQWREAFRQIVAKTFEWIGPGPMTLLTGHGFARPEFPKGFSAAAWWHWLLALLDGWLTGGIPVLLAVGIGLGFLHFLIVKGNPFLAAWLSLKAFFGAALDFLWLPFGTRRILALAKVAALEAVRGQVLYVFLLFLFPMLFAGWYLPKVEEGKLLYLVGYLNTAMTYTLLPMAAFMVAMSLPKDIQSRVIQTVATKPVRRLEILVGRVLGYTAVFTVVLLLMAAAGLWFLSGQLTKEEREKYWVARAPIYANRTPTEARQAQIAEVLRNFPNAPRARAEEIIPEFGEPLMFKRKEGWEAKGLNVGKEWYGYRWHIPGAYNSSAVAALGYKYDARAVETVLDKSGQEVVRLFVECDIYKSNKGDALREADIGKDADKSGVFGEIRVKGAGGKDKEFVRSFAASHLRAVVLPVPAELFKEGLVEVYLRCLSPGQFLGVGRSDVYFLTGEASFAANFLKAMSSLWLKLFFLVVVAVAASAALKGFVAVLATMSVFALASFFLFLMSVIDPRRRMQQGGGPLESLYRLYTQNNQMTPLDENLFTWLMARTDQTILFVMQKASFFVPDLADLDTIAYVAQGVDLPWALVVRNAVFVAMFALPALFVGHLVLKHRELAAT